MLRGVIIRGSVHARLRPLHPSAILHVDCYAQVANLFDKYDVDGSGELDIPEICRLMLESNVSPFLDSRLSVVKTCTAKPNIIHRYCLRYMSLIEKMISWKEGRVMFPSLARSTYRPKIAFAYSYTVFIRTR